MPGCIWRGGLFSVQYAWNEALRKSSELGGVSRHAIDFDCAQSSYEELRSKHTEHRT